MDGQLHYHLLIESTKENLSLFMRQINSNFVIYFNKKYRRTGHLWQGRYRSWYIINEDYCIDIETPPLTSIVVNEKTGLPGSGLIGTEDVPLSHIEVFSFDWLNWRCPDIKKLKDV